MLGGVLQNIPAGCRTRQAVISGGGLPAAMVYAHMQVMPCHEPQTSARCDRGRVSGSRRFVLRGTCPNDRQWGVIKSEHTRVDTCSRVQGAEQQRSRTQGCSSVPTSGNAKDATSHVPSTAPLHRYTNAVLISDELMYKAQGRIRVDPQCSQQSRAATVRKVWVASSKWSGAEVQGNTANAIRRLIRSKCNATL